MRLLALLLLVVLAGPANAELSGEFAIEHPVARPDPNDVTGYAAGGGPNGWLVLYTHDREPTGTASHAARLDSDLNVLDPTGLAGVVSPNQDTSVIWNESEWLIVSGSGFAQTISADGVVGSYFAVAGSSTGTPRWARAACGETECMVTWWRFVSGVGHFVQLGRVEGQTVTATDLPTTIAVTDQHEPGIAWNGSNYLVVWRDIRRPDAGDIYGQLVSPSGELVGADFAISNQSTLEDRPAVAWNGSQYLVVWRDGRAEASTQDLYGARVTADGDVLDPDGFLIESAIPDETPWIHWNGVEYLVRMGGRVIRVSSEGTAQDVLPALAYPVATAAGSGDFLIAYAEAPSSDDDTDLYAARVTTSAVEPRVWLGGVPTRETYPAAASDGANVLLAWIDGRDGAPQVYGMRLDGSAHLDGTGFALSPQGWSVEDPAVAFGDGVYLVTWVRQPTRWEGKRLEAIRVGLDGTVLDSMPIQVAVATELAIPRGKPEIAWNGESFMVVWEGWDYIVGTRIGPDGELLDTEPVQISTESDRASVVSIAWSGTVHMVTWSDHRENTAYVYGARLGLDGRPLDSENIQFDSPGFDGSSSVAGSEHGFLLGDGHLLDASGNVTGRTDAGLGARLAWDGASYLSTRIIPVMGDNYAVRYELTRIGLDGEVLSIADVGQSPAVTSYGYPVPIIAAARDGKAMLIYPRHVTTTGDAKLREIHLHGRTSTETPIMIDPGGSGGADGETDGSDDGGCSATGDTLPAGWAALFSCLLAALQLRRRPVRS